MHTRSYAALRAADLDWIIGPGYSSGGYILEKTMKNQPGIMKNHWTGEGGRAGISKNVTYAGSQLTWEGGGAGISKNVTDAGSQLTF